MVGHMIVRAAALSMCLFLVCGFLKPAPVTAATNDETVLQEMARQADVARAERTHLYENDYWRSSHWERAGKNLAKNAAFSKFDWPDMAFFIRMTIAGAVSQPLGELSDKYKVAFINPVYDAVLFVEYEKQVNGNDVPSNAWLIPGETIRNEPLDGIMVRWLRRGHQLHGDYIDYFIGTFRKLVSTNPEDSSVEVLQKRYAAKYAGKNDPRHWFEMRVAGLAAKASEAAYPCMDNANSVAQNPGTYLNKAVQTNIDAQNGIIKNQTPGLVGALPYRDGVLGIYTLINVPEVHYIISSYPENGQCRVGHIMGVYWGHAMYDATHP